MLVVIALLTELATMGLACGGSSPSTSGGIDSGISEGGSGHTCAATVSGGITTTMSCTMQALSNGELNSFGLYGFDTAHHQLGAFIMLAAEPQAGTYSAANVTGATGLFAELPDGGGKRWIADQTNEGGPIGTFSLDVTDLGPVTDGSAGSNVDKIWPSPHGSYTATYEAEPGGSATGIVTVSATF